MLTVFVIIVGVFIRRYGLRIGGRGGRGGGSMGGGFGRW